MLNSDSLCSPRKLKALRDSKRFTTIDFGQDEKRESETLKRRRKSEDFLDHHVSEKKSLIKVGGPDKQREKKSPIEVGGPDKQREDLGELGKIAQELRGNVVLEESYRSGASSPSPSIGESACIESVYSGYVVQTKALVL